MIQLVGDVFGLPPDIGEEVAGTICKIYAETFDTIEIMQLINQLYPDGLKRDLAFFVVGRMHVLAEFVTEPDDMMKVLIDFNNWVAKIRNRIKP